MLGHERPADNAEQPAGERGPEPVAVVVRAQPAPERQQHDERDEEQRRADEHDAPPVGLHRRRAHPLVHESHLNALGRPLDR